MTAAVGSPAGRTSPPGGDGPVRVRLAPATWACWSDRAHGDVAPGSAEGPAAVAARRAAIAPYEWTWLTQVHGARAIVVDQPGAGRAAAADAAVTATPGAVVSVLTADCASIALWTDDGRVGAAHAGWRGLRAGVLEASVAALRSLAPADAAATGIPAPAPGAVPGAVHAAVGPVIGPCCYEFGPDDLDGLVAAFGSGVRSHTTDGRLSLDLVAGASVALARVGVALDVSNVACTACSDRYFSHRARRDVGRQALAVWREVPA